MYTVEFHAKITDGKIEIPKEYLQELGSDVKIIILSENSNIEPIKLAGTKRKSKSIKGILSQYANPELTHLEKEAWGKAVYDKHASN